MFTYDQALANDSWNPPVDHQADVCLHAAHAAIKLNKYCEAIEMCQQALSFCPMSTIALALRAEARVRVYEFKAALQDYAQLVQLEGEQAWKAQVTRTKDFIRKLEDLYQILVGCERRQM